jgi:hypothetical protein
MRKFGDGLRSLLLLLLLLILLHVHAGMSEIFRCSLALRAITACPVWAVAEHAFSSTT